MISARHKRRGIATLAIFMAVLVATATPAAAAGPALNFSDDRAPNPVIVEDTLTVAEHDRGMMDGALEYYNDNGELAELNATINSSQTTPVGLRFDNVQADAYGMFPRVDAEGDNDATWTKAADWTKSSGANSGMTITGATTDGVETITASGSVATGETATATFGSNVSITSDANKRVLTFGGNVNTLASGATVEIRAVDGDGDYRTATIDPAQNGSDTDVIATGTGNGFVFQEKLSNLPLTGAGDGAFDGIQQIDVVTIENNAEVEIAWLDADRKGTVDLAEIERDTNGDGSLETTMITDYYEGGVAQITSLSTLGSTYDTASINNLRVYDVHYQLSDLGDSSEYSTNFSKADAYSYPEKLEVYGDLEVDTAIDLSHGAMTLEFDQGVPTERYVTFETANGVDSSEEFGNLSSAYTDQSGSLSGTDTTAELVASASADTTYRFHAVILYQTDELNDVQDSGAPAGPTGSSGGGFWSSIWGKLTAVGAIVGGGLGLSRVFGGGGGN